MTNTTTKILDQIPEIVDIDFFNKKYDSENKKPNAGKVIEADVITIHTEGMKEVMMKRKNSIITLDNPEHKITVLEESIQLTEKRIKEMKNDLQTKKKRLNKMKKLLNKLKEI